MDVAAAEAAAARQYVESIIGIPQVDPVQDIAGRTALNRERGPLAHTRRRVPLVRLLKLANNRLGYRISRHWDESAPRTDFNPADYLEAKAGELRVRVNTWANISGL
jgi:hypothetical protein